MITYDDYSKLIELLKYYRCEQDLNLRGKIPLDFKSNALTTRPSQHMYNNSFTQKDILDAKYIFTFDDALLSRMLKDTVIFN